MADYIRRDIVLKIINTVNDTGGFAGYADYCVLFDEIDTMPAADVQRVKRGEWEKKSSVGVFRCSLCQHIFMLGADEIDEYHFCPNCGADMRGDENG